MPVSPTPVFDAVNSMNNTDRHVTPRHIRHVCHIRHMALHDVASPDAADGRHALPQNRGRPRVDVRQELEGWRAVPQGGAGQYHR